MLRIFSFILSIFFSLGFFSYLHAADTNVSQATTAPKTELTIKTVKTLDSTKIRIIFTEAIDTTSIILKISKQSDNGAIGVGSITGVVDSPESIDVNLDDELEEGSSYSLTIIAAIGVSGATITDGANALKDFVTPTPLKKATKSFNAPTNPTAVSVDIVKPPVEKSPIVPEEETPVPTEELPLTGMNPLIFLLVILPLAYIFLRRKAS